MRDTSIVILFMDLLSFKNSYEINGITHTIGLGLKATINPILGVDYEGNKMNLPPLPEHKRAFFCTKCGNHECLPGTEKEKHPPCNRCGYLGFGENASRTDEDMIAYAEAAIKAYREDLLGGAKPIARWLSPEEMSNTTLRDPIVRWTYSPGQNLYTEEGLAACVIQQLNSVQITHKMIQAGYSVLCEIQTGPCRGSPSLEHAGKVFRAMLNAQ